MYYADDGLKIVLSLEHLQILLNSENLSLNDWNLELNPNKTKIIKYSRSDTIKNNTFPNENNLYINGEIITWNKSTSNIVKFLGFYLNFNIKDYLYYHLNTKINNFSNLQKKLYLNNTLGDMIPIDIQTKLYKSKIRMAFIFGLKISFIKKYQYEKLDSVQQRYLTSIIGGGRKMDNLSLRILLGLPRLSDFIIKLKLSMYYDIFKSITHKNIFTEFIQKNYNETYQIYRNNNNSFKAVKNQWLYPTLDYIQSW